jgi:hypothetical protein
LASRASVAPVSPRPQSCRFPRIPVRAVLSEVPRTAACVALARRSWGPIAPLGRRPILAAAHGSSVRRPAKPPVRRGSARAEGYRPRCPAGRSRGCVKVEVWAPARRVSLSAICLEPAYPAALAVGLVDSRHPRRGLRRSSGITSLAVAATWARSRRHSRVVPWPPQPPIGCFASAFGLE